MTGRQRKQNERGGGAACAVIWGVGVGRQIKETS